MNTTLDMGKTLIANGLQAMSHILNCAVVQYYDIILMRAEKGESLSSLVTYHQYKTLLCLQSSITRCLIFG